MTNDLIRSVNSAKREGAIHGYRSRLEDSIKYSVPVIKITGIT